MIKLNNISKSITRPVGRRRDILRGFSLEVKGGELALVVGSRGSGKSVLMMIAGGLTEPDSGTVDFITQPDIYSLSSDELAYFRNREIGCVFHKFNLIQRLSVYGNIMIPDIVEPSPASAERAETLLRKFEIVQHRERLPRELSMLDRQKTGLARAMLHLPRVLLADEPTENLDAAGASAILAALRGYADEGNSVIVFTRDANLPVSADAVVEFNHRLH